ncbi:oxidoreductase [Micromonospora sp. NBC_01699]|uniref:oxidoreductase n=1 Tax=Micromonospora sp. NBC_01699 TaxID=2975984 RepID=UPI002E322612|nr:oxidoreductase [Micromonospora sp. NBC_01699]
MPRSEWTGDDVPDQHGRVAVITGGNSGIGFETAKLLASRGAAVVLGARDVDKGKRAATRIAADIPGANVTVLHLDLASLASVRAAADQLRATHTGIDLLINNAGVMRTPRGLTADGFELHFGTNHLGHFALTGLLLDMMLAVPHSRVVTVSSADHRRGGAINLDDPNWNTREYHRVTAYAHSKVANLMFTYELQRRLSGRSHTIATAAHPGGSDTEGSRTATAQFSAFLRMAFTMAIRPLMLQNAEMGALPTLRAATDPTVAGGEYYGPGGFLESKGYPKVVRSSAPSHDEIGQRRLWTISEELTGVAFPV